jgi:phosphate-selective porin OprO/OprP
MKLLLIAPAGCVLALAGPAAAANLADVLYDGIPRWEAGNGVTVDIRGRAFYDLADGDQDYELAIPDVGDSEWRAARLGADITAGDLKITAEFDIAGDDFQFADLYAAWTARENLVLTAGHFKEAFSLDELTSARFTSYMERGSFTDAFDLRRRFGASAALAGANWSWTTALQAGTLDGLEMPDESWAASSRVTFAPVLDEDAGRYVHLGAALRYRETGGDSEPLFRYRQRPLIHLAPYTVATPRIGDSDTTYGLEAAAGFGAFHAEAEYSLLSADGPAVDADFSGFYISGGWFVTGEHRTYEAGQGRFDRTSPNSELGRGGFGALELNARYDQVDLTDGTVIGGEQDSITLGATWYPTARTRIVLNYVEADVDDGEFGDGDSQIWATRFQIDW